MCIWQTDDSGNVSEELLNEEYLLVNGIYTKSIRIDKTKGIAWVEVDASKTNLNEFYTWNEVLASTDLASRKPECWRSYYFFVDGDKNDWWTPKELSVEAEIQEFGNSHTLFQEIVKPAV